METRDYWRERSVGYNQLQWAQDTSYKDHLLKYFDPGDLALDLGCGTGIMMDALEERVNQIIGVDISEDMLGDRHNTICWDAHNLTGIFSPCVFDKILMRMVLHHIMEETEQVLEQCYWVLTEGGSLIVAEGIPPHSEIKEEFRQIFEAKEERLVFTDLDLVKMFQRSPFQGCTLERFVMPSMSIRNWLDNSGLDKATKDTIMQLHFNSSSAFKKAYRMVILEDDCLCDFHVAIAVGIRT